MTFEQWWQERWRGMNEPSASAKHEAEQAWIGATRGIVEVALCEIQHLILQEGVLYRFKKMHGCLSCQNYVEGKP